MRNFILIFVLMVSATLVKAQETMTISWLPTDEARTSSYGMSSAATFAVFMEFYQEDLMCYKTTAKSIVGIQQIRFHLDTTVASSALSNCKVVIMQGADIATATVKYTQNVTHAQRWNIVDLNSDYTVDSNLRLYIGYEVTTSSGVFPLSVAKGTDPKQAWLGVKNQQGVFAYSNYADKSVALLIKAKAVIVDAPDDRIAFTSLELDKYIQQGGNGIKGAVKNLGKTPITSFKVSCEINGDIPKTDTFNGLNILPGTTYNFSLPQYTFDEAKFYEVVATVSEPNEVIDGVIGDATRKVTTMVYAQKLPRVVLHEVFTSSTCPPCKAGNETLTKVLNAADKNKWVCIKYQWDFPGNGDPYFTAECATRGALYDRYTGTGVPHLICDGGEGFNDHPGYYTLSIFNQLAGVPAIATTTGTATVSNKKVDLSVTINPVISIDNPNLRFFAAVVEKETFNNRYTTPNQSNGETVFHYVMKKFMTSVNGDAIDPLVVNTPITCNKSYTFNGNYRQPANANSPINHATENSVEDFSALMVVYWLQDIVTKEVYQAGKADPNPSYQSKVSVEDIALTPNRVIIFPNPAKDNVTIFAAEPIQEVVIHNMLGQKVAAHNGDVTTVSVSDLSSGVYVITVKTANRVLTQKFVKE